MQVYDEVVEGRLGGGEETVYKADPLKGQGLVGKQALPLFCMGYIYCTFLASNMLADSEPRSQYRTWEQGLVATRSALGSAHAHILLPQMSDLRIHYNVERKFFYYVCLHLQ